jgi:hypothetical protein
VEQRRNVAAGASELRHPNIGAPDFKLGHYPGQILRACRFYGESRVALRLSRAGGRGGAEQGGVGGGIRANGAKAMGSQGR